MFFKLRPNLAVRSWSKMPYSIANLSTGQVFPISDIQFQALSFCDGLTDSNSLFLTPTHKKIIKEFTDYGLVETHSQKSRLNADQTYKSFDNEYVYLAHWSITGNCNFKCRHCYLSAPHAKFGQLSKNQCLDIISQLAECGIMNVSLTGGEPLIRKDFMDLIDEFNRKNIIIDSIYTNGALVNEYLLNELEERNVRPMFSLSFDGVGWHDWLRGVNGAEKMAIDAIKLLNKKGFAIDVEMCIHKYNAHTLEETVNLLSKLGVKSIKTNPVGNSGEWLNECGKHDLSRQELYDIYLDYIPKFFKAGSPITLHLGGFFYCKKGSTDYYLPAKKFDGTEKALSCKLCDHAKNFMYICADGQLLPCMSLCGTPIKEKKTYITKTPLRDALKSSHYLSLVNHSLKELLEKNPICNDCEYKLTCGGGCRASAVMTNGNYLDCDAAICDIFKKGYIEKIRRTADDALKSLNHTAV